MKTSIHVTRIQTCVILGCITLLFTACSASRQSASIRQSYQPAAILAKADSIVIALYGERVFKKHFRRVPLNIYSYKPKVNSKKEKTEVLSRFDFKRNRYEEGDRPTKGYFCGAAVSYIFTLNEKDFKIAFDNMLILDENLNPRPHGFLRQPPQYVLNNDTYNFISYKKAIETARKFFEKRIDKECIGLGDVPRVDAKMECETFSDKYYWEVRLLLSQWQDCMGDKIHSRVGIAEIDAVTSEIITTSQEDVSEYFPCFGD